MYFGGTNGVTTFDPKKILDNPYPPKVNITSLYSAEERININEYVDREPSRVLKLNPSQNSLNFSYAAIQHDNPEQIMSPR